MEFNVIRNKKKPVYLLISMSIQSSKYLIRQHKNKGD